ncbi:MAG TPA: xylulokinase [Clostridia bacterium]|nr:xylulokinase [Clostridia bacterium]
MEGSSAMGKVVAGVDCSTQATKVLVVDVESGAIVATGRAGHTVSGDGGARETDPREWWEALRAALAQTGRAGDVEAVAVGGQQHGLVVLGADGEPLRPAMLWNDTRSAPQALSLADEVGAATLAERVGSRPVASFTVTKWAWLRANEPVLADAAVTVRLPHDYLTERLTGHGVTDRGDASGTGWWSTADGTYAGDILALPSLRLDEARLPRVLGPFERAGEVTAEAAAATGLRAGIPVGPGTGDNMGAALGLGLGAGQVALSLGTSGTAFAVSDRRPADPSGIVAGFADATGRFLPLACTLNCTLAVDRVAGMFGLGRDDVADSGEVVVLPWFDGERTPDLPGAAGTMVGLRHDTRPEQILMAAYEGAIASLLDAVEAIAVQSGGLDAGAPLVVLGGGARGRTWVDVVRRLSGRPVLIPAAEELVALGAAVQAAAVLLGDDAAALAARWGTGAGTLLEPAARDDERLERIGAVRAAIVETPVLAGAVR